MTSNQAKCYKNIFDPTFTTETQSSQSNQLLCELCVSVVSVFLEVSYRSLI